jgi:hypothetical protein
VVAAQAFQWAQADLALPEIRRILRPHAWFTALWNADRIADEPVLRATYAMLRRHVPQYRYVDRSTWWRRWFARVIGVSPGTLQRALVETASFVNARERIGRGLRLLSTGDFDACTYHEVEHVVRFERDVYLDLWRSRNRLQAAAMPEAFAAFIAELTEYLDRRRIDVVTVPYVCGAWSARARDAGSR